MFDTTIASVHRAGDVVHLSSTLASLAVCFDRIGQLDVAATLYGTSTHHGVIRRVIDLPAAVDHLEAELGKAVFDECVANGAAMERADAVRYARQHIQHARPRATPA